VKATAAVKFVRGMLNYEGDRREPRANKVPAAAVRLWRGSVTGHH